MNLFKKTSVDVDEYLIRLDALQLALDFTVGVRNVRPNYSDREFLTSTEHIADYLRDGRVPEILGKATKAVIKG